MVVLSELSFDLQVQICEFLQPPQILALRQTCKALHQVTSQRVVWIHALKRICHDNFLFLPTFPICDMSIAELERAATAPFRWIALSSPTVWRDRDIFHLPGTRTIEDPIPSVLKDRYKNPLDKVYLVPGGRYLVLSGWRFLSVWDLGHVSDTGDGRQIGICEAVDEFWGYIDFLVHPTPDGLGIRILATSEESTVIYPFYVFEIYPQQKTPKLAQLAEFIINNFEAESQCFIYSLSGNRVVIYEHMKRTFIIWDFMANTVASWSITMHYGHALERILRVTKTVIIIHGAPNPLLIFEIPPLKAKKTLFDINEDLPIVNPVLNYVTHLDEDAWFQKPDGWYSGDLSSLPLCVDIKDRNLKRRRYRLDIARDFSTIRLVPLSIARSFSIKELGEYRICDDRFVNVCNHPGILGKVFIELDVCGGFGLSPNRLSQAHSLSQIRNRCFIIPLTCEHSSYCPVSAMFAFINNNNVVVSDFLK